MRRERDLNVNLNTLQEFAKALNCQLLYVLVPNESFEKTLRAQAKLKAKQILQKANHTMNLENQGLTIKQQKQTEENLINDLLTNNLKHLWDDLDEN